MRIGFKSSQVNVDWPTLLATGELADTREAFDSGWIFDHFVALGDEGGGSALTPQHVVLQSAWNPICCGTAYRNRRIGPVESG